ncbi:MAG: hypothetical protein IJW43_06615 [Clostridia bacterium]|nr:hypothetical protein [Clostridia bacterium]
MTGKKFKEQPIKILCNNCLNEIIGIRDENGVTKVVCKWCGTITVSKVMSRRHVQYDIYAPKGQENIQ